MSLLAAPPQGAEGGREVVPVVLVPPRGLGPGLRAMKIDSRSRVGRQEMDRVLSAIIPKSTIISPQCFISFFLVCVVHCELQKFV